MAHLTAETLYALTPPQGEAPRLRRGDIYSGLFRAGTDPLPGVVVTPACPIAQGKIANVVVCAVVPLADALGMHARTLGKPGFTYAADGRRVASANADAKKKLRNWCEDLCNANLAFLHLLPWLDPDDPVSPHHVALLTHAYTTPLAVRPECGDYIATISPRYADHLCARFATYFLQIGTDDIHADERAKIGESAVNGL
ncbi:MAG: hypothetical protein U1E39_13820 [Planctomycetota bacterium]